jgi:ribonucleotide reductase alpha subunit
LSGSHLNKNKFLDALLRSKDLTDDQMADTWSSIIANDGSAQHLTMLDENEKFVFKTAMEIDQFWVIEHAADRQQHIDQAQSLNLFFRPDVNVKYLHAVHFMAWKRKVKTLYYARSEKLAKADKVSKRIEREIIKELDMSAIAAGEIGEIILGRDHHDVSGTDSPYRETSNIYDGSKFTADMAIQNVIGDGFRGATWISIHNGGGVGWGEVINGGFGMLLDGSKDADRRLKMMLHWDVNNGIARRNWARNENATFAIQRAMEAEPLLQVTMPNLVDEQTIQNLFD